MKFFIIAFTLLLTLPSFATRGKVIDCSIGNDADYLVLINLEANQVQLWERAGSGVSYPALVTDRIQRQFYDGNKLMAQSEKFGRIDLSFNGWGRGQWKHNHKLDRHLQYVHAEDNSNGVAQLVECVQR